MRILISLALSLVSFIGILFLSITFGTIVGAFSGWVVGLFFGKTILSVFAALGLVGFQMWQIGAALGFISGFFGGKKKHRHHRRNFVQNNVYEENNIYR
ncbi:MAG: hypothetical protein LBR35_00255 [Rickettsiales bacterium]|jgi:hypothetical protein|nr:hypothetical protein [Rickettsiales bacterium]